MMYEKGIMKVSEKDINDYLCSIKPLQFNQTIYSQTLKDKQRLEKQVIVQNKQMKIKRHMTLQETVKGQYCEQCYSLLTNRRKVCGECIKSICFDCVGRVRCFEGQDLVICKKCDIQMLTIQMNNLHQLNYLKVQGGFKKLLEQNKILQKVIEMQKQKLSESENKQRRQLMKNMQLIEELKVEIKDKHMECQQTRNKIKWGRDITRNLKQKYRNLKALHGESFHSQIKDLQDLGIQEQQAPKAESQYQVSIVNINQSLINSFWEEHQPIPQKQNSKCSCSIY